MKRIGLFLLTNIAVLAVIAVLFSVFGIGDVLDEQGRDLDLGALLIFSAVIGFTGLLQTMRKNEIDALLGHEIAHIANGDIVTLALIQHVVNTFVIFLSHIVGHFVDRVILKNERDHGLGYFVSSIIAQILFGILASMIVSWFSRRREFRADEGGAHYAGTENMIAALEALKGGAAELPDSMVASGISGGRLAALFATHPPLETRIAALRAHHDD